MTIVRKEAAFPGFHRCLFTGRMDGRSMLNVWVKLACQVPGATGEGMPHAIFAAELGRIRSGL